MSQLIKQRNVVMKTEKLTSIQCPYLLPPPAVGDLQRCHTDSIVQPRERMFWTQSGTRHIVCALRTTANTNHILGQCLPESTQSGVS